MGMSKIIETTNIDNKGVKHMAYQTQKNSKGKWIDSSIKLGKCIFPFKYRGKEYNDCVDGRLLGRKGVNGRWCATEITPKGGTKRIGFCIEPSQKPEKPTKKKLVVSPPKYTSLKISSKEITKPVTKLNLSIKKGATKNILDEIDLRKD